MQNLARLNTEHSWLFVGAAALTLQAAEQYSQWLLCWQKQNDVACGTCAACNLFHAHTHPDFLRLTPQPEKHSISIEDVRSAIEFSVAKPQCSAKKIVLIYPAEAMLKQAANALLKSLEEPSGDTIYILLAQHRELLLKTIISRCQTLNIRLLSEFMQPSAGQNILPQMISDLCRVYIEHSLSSVQIVESWVKQWPREVLFCFEIVLTDIIRFKYTQDPSLGRYWVDDLITLSNRLTTNKLWDIITRLRSAQFWLGQNPNLNMQLLLEDMLLTTNIQGVKQHGRYE